VQLMNKAPLGPLMAHAMGALHNIMLTDAKVRAYTALRIAALAAPIQPTIRHADVCACDMCTCDV
jgi:hypothetical protein